MLTNVNKPYQIVTNIKKCYQILAKVNKSELKGVQIKTLVLNIRFAHISASIHWIFKILVPTPHNTPPIMWVDTRILKIQCIEAEIRAHPLIIKKC